MCSMPTVITMGTLVFLLIFVVIIVCLQLQKFDLSRAQVFDLEFDSYFELTIQKHTTCHVSDFLFCILYICGMLYDYRPLLDTLMLVLNKYLTV